MTEPLLAIALASYETPMGLWKAQLASLRRQTWTNWVCLLQDDASSPAAWARLRASVRGDKRFKLGRNRKRLGFYLNFEAALKRVPAKAAYVAFCDQDDRWDATKLERSVAALEHEDAQLVHCNLRLVDARGKVLAPSNWIAPGAGKLDLECLSLANSVTGAASVFRRAVLDPALPFPRGDFALYHDHWIALNALALGRIAYVREPLYSYVQHGANALGHGAAPSARSLGARVRHRLRSWALPSAWPDEMAAAHTRYPIFLGRANFFAATLLQRLGPSLSPDKRRDLEHVQAASRSIAALAALALRGWRRDRDIYQIEEEILQGELRLRLRRWGHKLGLVAA